MKATRLIKERFVLADTAFAEIVVWEVPEPVSGSVHSYKYRMALIVDQSCVLRYDNEKGKGDHKHLGDQETNYSFVSPEQLIEDFWNDVEALL